MKLKKLFKTTIPKNFAIVGGASANLALRGELEKLAKKYNFKLIYPKLEYCSDNAAMIGRVAVEMYKNKDFTNLKDLKVYSKIKFQTLP